MNKNGLTQISQQIQCVVLGFSFEAAWARVGGTCGPRGRRPAPVSGARTPSLEDRAGRAEGW